jgi:CIC family chloride channel protein
LDRLLHNVRRGEHAFVVVSAAIIGVLVGYGAIGFRYLIRIIQDVFYGVPDFTLEGLAGIPWWLRLLAPAVGGLAVGGLITRFVPETKGSGIPEVMEAVVRLGGAIRFRLLWAKTLAAAITIGTGGSAGREGPIVHIGSALGSQVGQFLGVSARRLRTFVAAGAAGAIAATFNAPIAGTLFSVEVVLGDYAFASLAPIVISAVVATVVSRHYLGDSPAFEIPIYELVSSRELLLYAGLGLAAGLAAVAFIRLLYRTQGAFEASPIPEWLRPAVGGLGVGVIALAFPQVLGVGYPTITAALWGEAALVISLIVIAKMAATSLTIGSGGSGGVFAPALVMGASLGGAWGQVAHTAFPVWTGGPGAYALVGMGAMVAGVSHAPISAILIIFELTNDYRIIPPLMVACVLSVLLSSRLYRPSVYTAKLHRRGVRLREGRDVNLLRAIAVSEVMEPDPETVPADLPFKELVPRLLADPGLELQVVDDDHCLLGTVSLRDVRELLLELDTLGSLVVVEDVAQPDAPFVLPTDNLDLAMHLFGRTHRDEITVCADAETKRVVGIVSRDALIDSYNRRLFHVDLTGGFGSIVDSVRGGRSLEVVGGVHLAELEVPFSLVGRTLRESDVRRRWGVEILLIHTAGPAGEEFEGRPGRLPAPDVRLHPGDRLLVMGTPEAIHRLTRGLERPANRRSEE